MTSQQISCFLKVAKLSSFTKAAEDMFISQPAVSRQISSLENELNLLLFDRHYEKTKLTAGGEVMFDFFSKVQNDYYKAIDHARTISPSIEKRITLGILSDWTLSTAFLPFQEALQGRMIDCQIEFYDYKTLVSMLRNRKLDAVLTMDISTKEYPDLVEQEVCTPYEVILFSQNHHLAEQQDLTPLDFEEEVFLVPPHLSDKEKKTTEAVRDIISHFGFLPKTRPVSNRATMLEYVRSGLGVCLNITWAKECTSKEFKHIVIDHTHPVSLVWKKTDDSSVIKILAQEISKWL